MTGAILALLLGQVLVPEDYFTIQEAIDAVADGDEISVAYGVYRENLDFHGKRIRVFGRFTGAPRPSLFSEVEGVPILSISSGEGRDSIVERFRFKFGHSDRGGGIRCEDSSPTIRDCVFNYCHADTRGGAIAVSRGAPLIQHCEFIANVVQSETPYSDVFGGAVYCEESECVIDGCWFSANYAAPPVYAHALGGGIAIRGGNAVVKNSLFWDCASVATDGYAGVGGAFIDAGSCIFESNTVMACRDDSELGTGGVEVTSDIVLRGCIIRDNLPNETNAAYEYSNVKGSTGGTGNIDLDPLFSGSFILDWDSPCIDTGYSSDFSWRDLHGAPRSLDGDLDGHRRIDMGAFEHQLAWLWTDDIWFPQENQQVAVSGDRRLAALLFVGFEQDETMVGRLGPAFFSFAHPWQILWVGFVGSPGIQVIVPDVEIEFILQGLVFELADGDGGFTEAVKVRIR